MFKKLILVGLLAYATGITSALAEVPSKLNGMWILNAKATEYSIVNAPLPVNADKLAQWFGLASGYMCLFTYEFQGDIATASAYRGARKAEFQLLAHQGDELKYALKSSTSASSETLSVSILNDGNIRIAHSNSPEMGNLLWKRGQLKTEQATPSDVKEAMGTWLSSLQNIVTFLKSPPNPAFKKDALKRAP